MKKGRKDSSEVSVATDLKETKSRIEIRLKGQMRSVDQPSIGSTLVEDIADWGIWMRGRGGSACSDDWHVKYLRWTLLGRCREYMDYCKASGHPRAAEAIQAVQKVYDFKWPHNSSSGYIFHFLWGWLQLELEKPGECKPMSIQEQKVVLEKTLGECGVPILDWLYDRFGGVKAITGREKPTTREPESTEATMEGLNGDVGKGGMS